MNDSPYIVGVFQKLDATEKTVNELLASNFSKDSISVLIPKSHVVEDKLCNIESDNPSTMPNAVAGITTGSILGGILGVLTALVIPGLGSVFGTGMLLAGGGVIAGGLSGYLTTLEVSDEGIQWCQAELESGHILVVVQSLDRGDLVQSIFQSNGAESHPPIHHISDLQ